jgi:hypothetical protein
MLFTGLQPCIIRFVTPAKHHMKANLPHYQFSLVSHRRFDHTLPTRANAVTGGLTSTARLVVVARCRPCRGGKWFKVESDQQNHSA